MTPPIVPERGVPLTAETVGLLQPGDWLRGIWDGSVWTFDRLSISGRLVVRRPYKGTFEEARDEIDAFTFLGRPDADGWIVHDGGENPAPGLTVDWRNAAGDSETRLSDEVAGLGQPLRVNSRIIAWRPHVAAATSASMAETVVVPVAVLNEAAGILDCEGYGPLSLSLLSCLSAPAREPEGGAVDAFSPYEWANGDGPNGATPYGIDDLVDRFASALKEKLHAAEAKYGHDDAWKRDDWREDLCRQLGVHVQKGDPRDVAAYCAFAWHHGWSLAALTPKEAPELALEDAMRFGVGFIVDGQRVSPARVTVCRGEEAPAATGADIRAQVVKLLDELIAHIVAIGPDKPNLNTPMSRRVWREVFADLITALRAQPQAREDYSSLIAARCSALPDKLIDCPVCLAVDNERDRLAREEAQPVMTVTLVDAGPALAIRKWDNLGLTPGSHTLYTTPPTQPLAEGADAEKLRVAVEALEGAKQIASRLDGHDAEMMADEIEAIDQALAALQQEGRDNG